jgi:hypothetical protein
MNNKIVITPFFGELPPWFDKFKENFNKTLGRQGYAWLFTDDLADFNQRCKNILGFESPIEPGGGKLWDYRGCLGLLYEEEIKGFEFWATMDFDMCFGNVNKWFTDELLAEIDVWSNHHSYVNGCWSLYRNTPEVNNLFKRFAAWEKVLQHPVATGWIENKYSRFLELSGLRYRYSFFQGWPYTRTPQLHFEDGKLYQDGEEIAMFHFRRSKKFPL